MCHALVLAQRLFFRFHRFCDCQHFGDAVPVAGNTFASIMRFVSEAISPVDELRLPSAIEKSECVLVAGAGGGFDVYAGLPIYKRLRLLGKKVFLANLSFVSLGTT